MSKWSEKDESLQKLRNLKPSQSCSVQWFRDGGGEVHRVYDVYVLFEIPQYGGKPRYIGTYGQNQLSELVDTVYSWA